MSKSKIATKLVKKITRLDKKLVKASRKITKISGKMEAKLSDIAEPVTFNERDAVEAKYQRKIAKHTKRLNKAQSKREKVGAKLLAEHDINIAAPHFLVAVEAEVAAAESGAPDSAE
jgi:hypothetical protein